MTRIIKSIPRGVFSGVVANYTALPVVASVPNKYYWVSASQGTAWLPGSFGGTYYPNGVYYSNGVTWEHVDTAFQASQADVDAGVITDQFVSPKTLKDAGQWTTKISHSLATAANDFLIASGVGVYVKKTLAEAKAILGITNVDNTSDINKPVSTAQAAADAAVLAAALLSKASAAEIITGTDDAKYTTALGLTNSRYLTQNQTKIYAVATGTDIYAITLSPAITSYVAGLTINVLFTNANTGAVTINVDGLGAKAVKKDGIAALVSGDIKAGVIYSMTYDGTQFQCDCGEALLSDSRFTDARTTKMGAYDNTDHSVTGTLTETYVGGLLVPQLTANSVLWINAQFERSGAAATATVKMYYNTTNNMSGTPVVMGVFSFASTSDYSLFQRRIAYKNSLTTNEIYRATVAAVTDLAANAANLTDLNIDLTGKYIVFAITLGNTGDTISIKNVQLLHQQA